MLTRFNADSIVILEHFVSPKVLNNYLYFHVDFQSLVQLNTIQHSSIQLNTVQYSSLQLDTAQYIILEIHRRARTVSNLSTFNDFQQQTISADGFNT